MGLLRIARQVISHKKRPSKEKKKVKKAEKQEKEMPEKTLDLKQMTWVEILLTGLAVIFVAILCYLIYQSETDPRHNYKLREFNNVLYREQEEYHSTVLVIHLNKRGKYSVLKKHEKKKYSNDIDEYYAWLVETELLNF